MRLGIDPRPPALREDALTTRLLGAITSPLDEGFIILLKRFHPSYVTNLQCPVLLSVPLSEAICIFGEINQSLDLYCAVPQR